MTTVVFILMILVCFNFLLKQTFVARHILIITTLVLGIFATLMWQVAIEQSKTQIADWLQNTELMRDIAVVLSVDVVAQLTFCILTVRMADSEYQRLRSRLMAKGLLLYPRGACVAGATHFPVPRCVVYACLLITGSGYFYCRTAWKLFVASIAAGIRLASGNSFPF